jgi:hypothetical protein
MTPYVTVDPYVSAIGTTTATISARVSEGAEGIAVYYGVSAGSTTPTIDFSAHADMILKDGVYSADLKGLTPDTHYAYKIQGTTDGKTVQYTSLYGFLTQQTPPKNTSPGTIVDTIGGKIITPFVGKLVPCDGVDPSGVVTCKFEHVIIFIKNLINFLIFILAPIIVALVLLWGGVLLLTSGGSTEKATKAKQMIFKALIGLVIAMTAWLIVQAVYVGFGYNVYNPGTNTGFPKFY